jgi:predicted aminopeptidase
LEEQNRQLQEELLILQQRDRIRSLLAESTTTAQKKSGDRYRD